MEPDFSDSRRDPKSKFLSFNNRSHDKLYVPVATLREALMGIEIQSSGKINPGQTATFTFQNPVQAFVLGISALNLTYGQDDHYIQELQIQILPGQEAVVGNVVTAQIEAEMHDGSGNTIDVMDSGVWLVCIANTGTDDPKTLLTNVSGIANNGTASVSLPNTSGFSVVESFLSGFTLQYFSGHEVLHADAGCGITYEQSNGIISANAQLYDSSGNQANTALIDAGVAVSTDGEPGFFMQEVTAQSTSLTPWEWVQVTFNSLKSISAAFAVIKSWKVQYSGPGDHWVKTIWVGVEQGVYNYENNVSLKYPNARISDASGNTQDNSLSNVTLVVIAVP
jgi:hypothetical protein